MKPASRRLQFGLRTMLLIVTLMGVYLAWRIHDPERAAVRVIRAAGGQVHFGYQNPVTSGTYLSVGMLPENEYYGRVDVDNYRATGPPPLTASEVLFRPGSEHRVRLVEIQLEQLTPEVVAHLATLRELQFVVVDMPAGVLAADSPEVKQLSAYREQLPGKIYPSFRPTRWTTTENPSPQP
jgi:hypothetical protein